MNNRRIFALVIIVVSVIGGVARYMHHKNEERKREELFRRLSLNLPRPGASEPSAAPSMEPVPVEPRPMLDSTLPQETFDLVRQTVGRDFKLMDVRFSDLLVTVKLSVDGTTVQHYQLNKNAKKVEGPSPVNVIGGGKLSDSLFDPKLADLSLIPKMAKEAVERAGLPEGKAENVSFQYPGIRYEGEGPEWTVYVQRGEGANSEHKFVMFDAKGKFKKMF